MIQDSFSQLYYIHIELNRLKYQVLQTLQDLHTAPQPSAFPLVQFLLGPPEAPEAPENP